MKKRFVLAVAAGLAAAAQAQEASTFKVYGFADASFEVYQLDNGFATNFVGTDTLSLSLNRANLYFDFKPNERIKALVEIGLMSRPKYTTFENGSDPAVITYQGKALTDAQILSIVTEQKLDQLAAANLPAGTPSATVTAYKDAARPTVAGQVSAAVQPQLTALRQKIAGNAVEERKDLSLERAQFDLMIHDRFNLRVGKWITPAGVWNVDHASPVILTARQPIQTTTTPIFPESQLGMMGFGGMPLGDHDLSYNLYVSSGRIDGAATQLDASNGAALNSLEDLAFGGHLGLKLDLLKSVQLGASFFDGAVNRKYSSQEIQFTLEDFLVGKPTNATMNEHYVTRERETSIGVDAKVEISNLLLQAEYNTRTRENEIGSGTGTVSGWYALAAWTQPVTADISVAPYAMFEQLSSELEGSATGSFNASGLAGFHTWSAGVNTTFFTNYHLKVEYMNLQFEKDPDTWKFTGISAKDLNVGVWSTQVAVAF